MQVRQATSITRIIACIVACLVALPLLSGCNILNVKSVSKNPKDLDALTFNSGGWSYDGSKDVYSNSFVYAATYDSPANQMTVSIPAGYLKTDKKNDDEYSVSVDKEGRSNVYESGSAPVVVYIGDRDKAAYLDEGAITVQLPEGASALDIQMAVRALKYNAHDNKKVFPGATKAIFLVGGNTVALAGVTADDESSARLFKQYGAVMKYDNKKAVSDKVLGVIIDSSAASMSVQNAAEAWVYAFMNGDTNQGVLEAADSYGEYVNGLEMISDSEKKLETQPDDNGHLLKGSYPDYINYMMPQINGGAELTYQHEGDYFPDKLDYKNKLSDPTEAMYYLTMESKEDYTASVCGNWQIGVCIDKPGAMLSSINLYTALLKHEDAKVGILPFNSSEGLAPATLCAWIRTATATEMEK